MGNTALELLCLFVLIPFMIAWIMIPAGIAFSFLAPFGFFYVEHTSHKKENLGETREPEGRHHKGPGFKQTG